MTQLELSQFTPPDEQALQTELQELQGLPGLEYSKYRDLCDSYSGFMRLGVDDPDLYSRLLTNEQDQQQLVMAATNESLGHPFNKDVVADERKIAIFPEKILDSIQADKSELVIYKQHLLSRDLVENILTTPDESTVAAITEELGASLPPHEQLVGGGVPEYIVLSKYDTSGCDDLKKSSPEDITLDNGSVITTSKEKILAKLPELIALHESVFSEQAMQIGYYGGLHKDGIEELINNPDFIPIAGFDGETGEALMFTLFAPNLKDMDSISWMNPRIITEVLDKDNTNKALAIPLVITSRANGLGMFSKTAALAGHETLHRTQADTVYVFCESSALSVLYTPKVLNRTLTKIGFSHVDTAIEATYLAEQAKSEPES